MSGHVAAVGHDLCARSRAVPQGRPHRVGWSDPGGASQRNLTIEPTETPDVYRITNRGVSEPWGMMSRFGEYIVGFGYGQESGVQNANWQRMMTGLIKKIEMSGGQAVTKPIATYGHVYTGGLQSGTRPTYDSYRQPF